MSAAATGSETYTIEDSTVDSETVVTGRVESQTESFSLTETEQIAAYFLEGLRDVAHKTRLDLASELGAREYEGDENLFFGMIGADVERLLDRGLIRAVYLVLWEPAAGQRGDNIYKVRYRAIYRIGQNHDRTQPERFGGALEPPRTLDGRTRFSLIVEWTPNTPERRARELASSNVHFAWRPTRAAAFDTSHLTDRSRVGGVVVGELIVTRIEQHTPDDLRRMG